ncbi:LuxR family transcriptional regulator [Sphingomonas parva]|uniref:LuxR family transcriptional regulator n=1 Tax=Sphingomonas parva TaxID=2555898 RepID=A0A4Y8ZX78_9SPHN|nr:LuxR family transcriptional regulator [Sphingomonas parva]
MSQMPLDQLTEAQRECLRLVLSHHNSKEIAAKLGVSPSAVDKRIERAVQILRAPSRFAAARALAEHEGGGAASERLPSEPIDVPNEQETASTRAQDEPRWLVRRLLGLPPGRLGWRQGSQRTHEAGADRGHHRTCLHHRRVVHGAAEHGSDDPRLPGS